MVSLQISRQPINPRVLTKDERRNEITLRRLEIERLLTEVWTLGCPWALVTPPVVTGLRTLALQAVANTEPGAVERARLAAQRAINDLCAAAGRDAIRLDEDHSARRVIEAAIERALWIVSRGAVTSFVSAHTYSLEQEGL